MRLRRYLVEDVTAPPTPGDDTLVRLSCLEDDAEGEELQVLWERELDSARLDEADWSKLARGEFDPAKYFAAYYRTLRWNTVTSTDPKLFQAPYRAGIRLDAYQLEPLRKALVLPRVNLFIADDVGLGKTIEAGLVVRELLLRQRIRRIVVAAPPSVVRNGVIRLTGTPSRIGCGSGRTSWTSGSASRRSSSFRATSSDVARP